MTNDEKRTEVERIVRQFTMQYVERKLLWQLGQIVPGADQIPAVREALVQLYSEAPDALQYTMEPQEWRTLALYGAGDPSVPPDSYARAARRFAGPYRHEAVPTIGHFMQREDPVGVAERVSAFLRTP